MHEREARRTQVVHDDLSCVQRQRAGTPCPLAVAVSYQNGDRNKHGEVVRGYMACGVTDHTAKRVERIYQKRLGIETTYRLIQ